MWIEIKLLGMCRLIIGFGHNDEKTVALLAEGVDRNKITWDVQEPERVALLAEGVDRNQKGSLILVTGSSRPPRGGRG